MRNTGATAPLSVLIVEDEPLIAMMLEDFVEGLGYRTAGTVDSVEDALTRVDEADFDVAILDVQLRDGEACWPVADALREKGVPFILASGGHLEPLPLQHAGVGQLSKPFTLAAVKSAIEAIVADR
jgi:CheY-like chemotaxis protein